MPRNHQVLLIAQDVRIIKLMLEAGGFITETIGLRKAGPNAEMHDLTDEQLAAVEYFLGAADVQCYAEKSGRSETNRPHGRHAGP